MQVLIKKSVHSDYGFLKAGAVVDLDESTARHYNRTGIGEPVRFTPKVDREAEGRQTKIVEPAEVKQKRKYQRRK